jgi:hypothetical protein
MYVLAKSFIKALCVQLNLIHDVAIPLYTQRKGSCYFGIAQAESQSIGCCRTVHPAC